MRNRRRQWVCRNSISPSGNISGLAMISSPYNKLVLFRFNGFFCVIDPWNFPHFVFHCNSGVEICFWNFGKYFYWLSCRIFVVINLHNFKNYGLVKNIKKAFTN